MNRFIIEETPEQIAESLCDQHIVKMPLEETQMLCSAIWHHAPDYAEEKKLYKPVHVKHPCSIWARENRDNYLFAWNLARCMFDEYTIRYKRTHDSRKLLLALINGSRFIPSGKMTRHPQCFSGQDDLKTNEFFPIKAYRGFYIRDKSRFARYNFSEKPQWFKEVA